MRGDGMKRVFLLFVIIGMCMLVALGGTMTFLSSNSVLKQEQQAISEAALKNLELYVDTNNNKMYLLSDKKVVKTYKISSGKSKTPSPIGEWTIVNKDTWGEGFGGSWMGFNVPWGKYGIHGTDEPWTIGKPQSMGCLRMYNKEVAELYKVIPIGAKVKVYGGIYGPFGNGFRVLKPGDRGADVYEVQKKLKEKGYLKGEVDGIYGTTMQSAVHKFQRNNKMKVSNNISQSFYSKLGVILINYKKPASW
jgi:hypothetical protein